MRVGANGHSGTIFAAHLQRLSAKATRAIAQSPSGPGHSAVRHAKRAAAAWRRIPTPKQALAARLGRADNSLQTTLDCRLLASSWRSSPWRIWKPSLSIFTNVGEPAGKCSRSAMRNAVTPAGEVLRGLVIWKADRLSRPHRVPRLRPAPHRRPRIVFQADNWRRDGRSNAGE